jgi:hypothetical protein
MAVTSAYMYVVCDLSKMFDALQTACLSAVIRRASGSEGRSRDQGW